MSSQPQVNMIGPHRIPMAPGLLKAARRGDERIVEDILARSAITIPDQNGDAPSPQDGAANAGGIDVPNGNAPPPQEQRVSILLGVTIGGNTALHIATTLGHLNLAEIICQRERSLLVARNVMLETPLHCAARAGHHQIVQSIIPFANRIGIQTVLRATNRDGKTALHEAIRNGHVEIANSLMTADPGLANMVDEEGISPLYLAAMVGSLPLLQEILRSLSSTTAATAAPLPLSYAGPNGQTALHAAAVRQKWEIAQNLLEWNKMLATHTDNSGNTPLHYAASSGNDRMIKLLLKHDTSLAYIADSSGLFPMHVAVLRGQVSIICKLMEGCPDSDELLDNEGRNLLHTAVQRGRIAIVRYVCQKPELAKLMNASDFEGNTPLHLAVKRGDQEIVGLLMRDKRVNSSIMNKEGLTPPDLSVVGLEGGIRYSLNPSFWILKCLVQTGALASPRRLDHYLHDNIGCIDLKEEPEKYLYTSQNLTISSVVIATVTFAAAFTLPGGYRADGTPTLAGKYLFKAFVIADTLAFILSVLSTCWNSYGGSVLLHPWFRSYYVVFPSALLLLASRCIVVAFALAIYLVLSPVSNSIGILVCVTTSTSLLIAAPNIWQIHRLAKTIKSRVGWIGLFKSCALRQHEGWMNNLLYISITRKIFLSILWDSLIFISIFLLALLK